MSKLLEEGRQRGGRAGRKAGNVIEAMQRDFRMMRELYPTVGDLDMAGAIRDFDRERLACTPDYTMFPEMRGLIDRHAGEREGFRDATGFDETAAAYFYSFAFFMLRRFNTRHVARYDLATPQLQCTNVFFPHGADGVTISDNRDDVPRPWYYKAVVQFRLKKIPKKKLSPIQGSVASATLLDEEPSCIFPCDPWELMPRECLKDIREMVTFMTRYVEFWGPANQLWVDEDLNAVAVEKSNCRVAYRYPTVNGAAAVTACSYLDPEMNAFKRRQTTKAALLKGETEEDSSDLKFSEACDRRHQRLWDLTNAEAGRPGGATIWGALGVVADEAVPFPERICLAGEKVDPVREANANWTLTQHAQVVTGPKRRGLYRSMQDLERPRSVTTYLPKLVLGEGVEMDPEWQADLDSGKCALADHLIEPRVACNGDDPQRAAARTSESRAPQ